MPQATLSTPAHGAGDSCHSPAAEEEEVGISGPAPGLLQVTERRRKYSWRAWHAAWGPEPPGKWGAGSTSCPDTPRGAVGIDS